MIGHRPCVLEYSADLRSGRDEMDVLPVDGDDALVSPEHGFRHVVFLWLSSVSVQVDKAGRVDLVRRDGVHSPSE